MTKAKAEKRYGADLIADLMPLLATTACGFVMAGGFGDGPEVLCRRHPGHAGYHGRQADKPSTSPVASNRFPVVCLECSRKFATASLSPRCPKCGGVDIEVR